MKKLISGAIALTMVVTASCNKADDTEEAVLIPNNTWKVGTTSYKATDVSTFKNIVTAASTAEGGSTIHFAFAGESLPLNGGIYSIKKDENGPYSVKVYASDNKTGGAYYILSGNLMVTMKDKKMILDLDGTTAMYVGSGNQPNVELSAHIEEK